MTPEQYAAAQAVITAGVATYVQRFASLFTGPLLSLVDWLKLLQVLFPEVQRRYAESSSLAREFYDSQRSLHHPELPRNERFLSELKWEWFVQNMEPARKELSQADSPRSAVAKVVLTAVREVEMAGRRQVIGAVNNDDDVQAKVEEKSDQPGQDENSVIGWARAATGRETCAWCLMLISRGAQLNHKGNFAYAEAVTAGLELDDETAIDVWRESGGDLERFREETEEHMDQWHTGCDCMVVPVFDVNDWPGRESAQRALRLWIEAGIEASKLIESGESRSKNTNKETLNALRRRLERGDLSMSEYAFAA